MQEQDEVIIKTVFVRDIISKLLHIVLERAGYDAKIQINDLNIMNNGERAFMHIDMSADGNMLDLKRSFKDFAILKGLAIKGMVKFFGNNRLNSIIEKMAADKNIDVQIYNLIINEKNGKLHICLNADGKIGNEDFKMILENAGLV